MAPLMGASPTQANEVMSLRGQKNWKDLQPSTVFKVRSNCLEGICRIPQIHYRVSVSRLAFPPVGICKHLSIHQAMRIFFFALYQFPNSQLRY